MDSYSYPLTLVNLIFCMVILVLSFVGYRKFDEPLIFYIGVAFGLFGISHLALLSGYPNNEVLIVIRTIAYLLVIFALYRTIRRQNMDL